MLSLTEVLKVLDPHALNRAWGEELELQAYLVSLKLQYPNGETPSDEAKQSMIKYWMIKARQIQAQQGAAVVYNALFHHLAQGETDLGRLEAAAKSTWIFAIATLVSSITHWHVLDKNMPLSEGLVDNMMDELEDFLKGEK